MCCGIGLATTISYASPMTRAAVLDCGRHLRQMRWSRGEAFAVTFAAAV